MGVCAHMYFTKHKITESQVCDLIFKETDKCPLKRSEKFIHSLYVKYTHFSHCCQNRNTL